MYFHEIPNNVLKFLDKAGAKILLLEDGTAEIKFVVKQPEWCSYPGALQHVLGCWSLTGKLVTGPDFCKNCECFNSTKVDIVDRVKEVMGINDGG